MDATDICKADPSALAWTSRDSEAYWLGEHAGGCRLIQDDASWQRGRMSLVAHRDHLRTRQLAVPAVRVAVLLLGLAKRVLVGMARVTTAKEPDCQQCEESESENAANDSTGNSCEVQNVSSTSELRLEATYRRRWCLCRRTK